MIIVENKRKIYYNTEERFLGKEAKCMRKLIAVLGGKLLTIAGKLIGKKSSSAPGEFALKVCPDLVSGLNKCVKKGVIITCGTNGKTTTNNLMCSALENKGYKVLCNRIGANMLSGIATVMVQEMNVFGKLNADYACFEVDEAYAHIVFDRVKPDIMVVTNLFRDQLDRYGEVDTTSELMKKAMIKVPELKVILNGDDPNCVQFSTVKGIKPYYYGISEQVLEQKNGTNEGKFCPVCGEVQEYNYYHYSQLGDFKCPKCGFKRPEIDFEVREVNLGTPMKFSVNGRPLEINYKGFYNIYNIAAVYGAMEVLGEGTDDFTQLLSEYKPQIGRMQEFKLNKSVILNLSKNPAGFNQAIEAINQDKRKKDVIIAVNDAVSDGRDISWFWDVEFDKVKNENLNELILSGLRVWDLGLRFKYEDITPDLMTQSMNEAIDRALKSDSEVVYAIVNYTALFPTETILNSILKSGGKGNE